MRTEALTALGVGALILAGGTAFAAPRDPQSQPGTALRLVQSRPLQDLASFPRAALTIRTGRRKHVFQVWVADTPDRMSQGLMFVQDLPAHQGMLFVHAQPRKASMWMKNTFIPLDMLFIRADGRIVKIAERTEPHSLASIAADVPVKAVLELRGGEARRRGIKLGHRVEYAHFGGKRSSAIMRAPGGSLASRLR